VSAPFPNLNAEQLDAEFQAGMSVVCNLDVSLTTLAHLVIAAQYAARCLDLANPSRAVWRDFAQDCVAKCPFPPETGKLIANGWPDEPVQTSGRKEEP
jgi:hypothetical protein